MPARIGGMGDQPSGPEVWFKALPLVTRFWFGGAMVTTLAGNLGIISIDKLVFLWEPLKDNFEVWRLITPFLYMGKFDIGTLFSLYFIVEYSKRYESSSGYNTGAGGGTADYIFAMLFAIVMIFISYPFVAGFLMPIFGRNLTYFVLYIWTKRYPTVQVSLWGFPIPALWLPFALLALNTFIGGSIADIVHGIVIGHLYYFLVDVVPLMYGKDYLHTPQFLIDYFGVGVFVPQAPLPPPPQQQTTHGLSDLSAPGRANPPQDPAAGMRRRGGGYNWGGSGQALGSN